MKTKETHSSLSWEAILKDCSSTLICYLVIIMIQAVLLGEHWYNANGIVYLYDDSFGRNIKCQKFLADENGLVDSIQWFLQSIFIEFTFKSILTKISVNLVFNTSMYYNILSIGGFMNKLLLLLFVQAITHD